MNIELFVKPQVKLVGAIPSYDLAVASARTCYSGKGIVWPAEVSQDEKALALRDRIAQSTREAGHLTTRQHAHFVFAISDVSRHCLWSFLHSHPYYNSEQVSQRYVKVRGGRTFIPPLKEKDREIYEGIVSFQLEAYEDLIELLLPAARHAYYRIFPARAREPKRWESTIAKRAYEVARYVLPVATCAYLYHTVSALTLMRYYHHCQQGDAPLEQKLLVDEMVCAVLAADPDFKKDLEGLQSEEKWGESSLFPEIHLAGSKDFVSEFDDALGGKTSRLMSYTADAEHLIGEGVRAAFGLSISQMSDLQAVAKVLDPKSNRSLGDVLGAGSQSKLLRVLHLIHFVFRKKLSHTADSQDQRHRTTPGVRPLLMSHYCGEPDFVLPGLIAAVPQAEAFYRKTLSRVFEGINQLLERGVSWEFAQYLLPNAFPVRFLETGDLLAFHHKWKLRTCYNAQEEIFAASVEELSQAAEVFPPLAQYLRAPCFVRKLSGITPFCPEKDRFCGLPVWNYDLEDYKRLI